MNKDKNYCWKCGKLLKKELVDPHYNSLAGNLEFNIQWTCPDYKWYQIFNRHEKFKSDEEGNTYQFEV